MRKLNYRKLNSKRLIVVIIVAALIVSLGFYKFTIAGTKYKDINYAVETYMTSGFFNKNKLYTVDDMKLSFSDGIIAVMTVKGTENKAPHRNMTYDVFLEKNKRGLWKVQKVYNQKSVSAD